MVTRKDLNVIAGVFNEQLLLLQQSVQQSLADSHRPPYTVFENQAEGVWKAAERMYFDLRVLNPKVSYTKWKTAVIKNCDLAYFDFIPNPSSKKNFMQ